MKTSTLTTLTLCLATAMAVGHARAQDDVTPGTQLENIPAALPIAAENTPAVNQNTSGSQATAAEPFIRTSRLVRTVLKNREGQKLGLIGDLIVEQASGRVQFVVVSTLSSAAGAPASAGAQVADGAPRAGSTAPKPPLPPAISPGGRLVAVPWCLLDRDGTANITRQQLERAPAFNASAWPHMDIAWMQRNYDYFNLDPKVSSIGAPARASGVQTGNGDSIAEPDPEDPSD